MMEGDLREAERESRWEAAPAVLLLIAMQLGLAAASRHGGWVLWRLPWWAWSALVLPELVLVVLLSWSRRRRPVDQLGRRRTATQAVTGLVGIGNGLSLLALIASLLTGHEQNGDELLLKGVTIWSTNVIAFGLWFWIVDRGGPVRRLEPDPPYPDWLFPQMGSSELAEDWRPRLVDYIYVSFTNSIAFSPTDALPLTWRAKLLMLLEAASSAITVVLVTARAVNILQ